MNPSRTPLWALVVWGMIPLAAFAGMPSTGCLCANGQFKFFCSHQYHSHEAHGGAANTGCCSDHPAAAVDCCCEVTSRTEQHSDCCQHGATPPGDGLRSQTCCQPVFNAPSMSPVAVSVPCDDAPLLTVCLIETIASGHPAVAPEAGELDTGPPLDRVVAFRHLLI